LASEGFRNKGVDIVDNTPEEIRDLAIEMDDRLRGVWVEREEDTILQKKFWALFSQSELNGVIYARIGAEFLRQNEKLLG
jgi:hypothetical protein